MQQINLDISTTRSDCCELQRDIATYEHLFLNCTTVLPSLLTLCDFVTPVLVKAEATQALTSSVVQQLLTGVTALSRLQLPRPPGRTTLLPRPNFQLRQPTTHRRLRLLFKGVREVSGLYCFLQVHSNGWFTAFKVHAFLLDGTTLKLKIHHSLAGMGSDLRSDECKRKVEQQLIKKLYLTVYQEALALRYHKDYGHKWQEFVVQVKGLGKLAVQLFRDGQLELPGLESMQLPSDLTLKQAARLVARHLHVKRGRLHWSEPESRFAAKEADSLLLNFAYVSEKLGTHLSGHITEYSLGGHRFSVELHTRGGVERVTVTLKDDVRVIDVETLRALQFEQLRTAWTTVLRSLELQLLTKRLFPELFA